MASYDLHQRAAAIVRDSGGQLVGRTRLQKVAYFAQLAGFGQDFPFEYRHYGPYSEELADAMEIAVGVKLVNEDEKQSDWGGWYSIYTAGELDEIEIAEDPARVEFISEAAEVGAIELELAATAAFLYSTEGIGKDGQGDPWKETAKLKPEKAAGDRLERAKAAYRRLQQIETPAQLPAIA